MENKQKVVLVILDGFGIGSNDVSTNAIYAAQTPFFDALNNKKYAKLFASEEPVGIAKNQFGNSELGHMTIGSGRTILGINERFNKLISDELVDKFLLDQKWVQDCLKSDNVIHLCGLYSSGCVHSNLKHFDALINFFQNHNKKIALYLISDGRDTSRHEFINDLEKLLPKLQPTTKIIAIGGRYYGMDRDKNWERTNQYFSAMLQNEHSITNDSFIDYVRHQYQNNIDDEFIMPIAHFEPEYQIKPNDEVVFLNYRADRIRQIIELFTEKNNKLIGLCEYPNVKLDAVIVDKQTMKNTLGDVLNDHNIKQLRVAETEKFAHVTFFFDAGQSVDYPNEKKILIPSVKVSTYDLKPEMSAYEITNSVINNLDKYDFIVVNYANADMVGHTGNFLATKQAIEILDKECATLYNNVVDKFNGTLLITSDHGNADLMVDCNKDVVKTHSIAKVPFYVLSNRYELSAVDGVLQDIAPSILYVYGINPPKEMDGHSLIRKK